MFFLKFQASTESEFKEQKITLLSNELAKIGVDAKKNETYISAFKRDLGNVASSMVSGRELEEAVRVLYKKYVRGEKGLDNMLKVSRQTRWFFAFRFAFRLSL